jgi:hypothetical protein
MTERDRALLLTTPRVRGSDLVITTPRKTYEHEVDLVRSQYATANVMFHSHNLN